MLGVLGRGLAGECPELLDEVSLVEIAAVIRQSSQIRPWVKHKASLSLRKAECAGEKLRRYAGDLLKPPFKVPHRRTAVVGEFLDATLTLGVMQ
jgi:hypothetical protein